MGVPKVFVVENGHVLEFEDGVGDVVNRIPGGYVYVDGLSVGDVGDVVLRDRHHLSRDGFVVAVLAINTATGDLMQEPDIITRGFVFQRDSEALLAEAKEKVARAFYKGSHPAEAQAKIKETLGQFFYDRTKRRPMILPLVMEV